jgi:predicted phage terminase large subunit-like protein
LLCVPNDGEQGRTSCWRSGRERVRTSPPSLPRGGSGAAPREAGNQIGLGADVAAQIERGEVRGKVIDIPAIAGPDDPVGRAEGEYLWDDPSGYDYGRFLRDRQRETSPMMWAALFQQKPAPEDGDYFKAEWFKPYDIGPAPETLRIYGASDFAVAADGGDFTVHGVAGVDPNGKLFLLDVWRKQTASDVWVEVFCDLVKKWKPMEWAIEKGQIASGVGPYLDRRQRESSAYVAKTAFPTRGDKAVGAQSIRGYIAQHGLYVPLNAPWYPTLRAEMLSFPAGRNDDQVDMLGLLGQLLDVMVNGKALKKIGPPTIRDRWNKRFGEDDSDVINWKLT